MKNYPDLNKLPTVLETSEVECILEQILNVMEKDPSPDRSAIAKLMADAFFAKGHRLDKYNTDLCTQILTWIKTCWNHESEEFADAALTVLANIECPGRNEYLCHLLQSEKRVLIKKEIEECITDLKISE